MGIVTIGMPWPCIHGRECMVCGHAGGRRIVVVVNSIVGARACLCLLFCLALFLESARVAVCENVVMCICTSEVVTCVSVFAFSVHCA